MSQLKGIDANLPSKQAVCCALQQFFERGWVTGTGGGISLQDPLTKQIITTPMGLSKEMLPHHLVVTELADEGDDKDTVETGGYKIISSEARDSMCRALRPSPSFPLFVAVHRHIGLPGSCVLQTHSATAIAVAQLYASVLGKREIDVSGLEMIKGMDACLCADSLDCKAHRRCQNFEKFRIAILRNRPHKGQLLPDFMELFRERPRATCCVVLGHGVFVWGVNFERAKSQLECLEWIFDSILKMRTLGIDFKALASNTIVEPSSSSSTSSSSLSSLETTDISLDELKARLADFIIERCGVKLLVGLQFNAKSHVLRLVDQRCLPLRIATVECTTAIEVHDRIRDMTVRGAPAIGTAAAFGMAIAAFQASKSKSGEIIESLRETKAMLDKARPTAVNLTYATSRVLAQCERAFEKKKVDDDIAEIALACAREIAESDLQANEKLSRIGAELIPTGGNVIHHCNTGSLATCGFGTALGCILMAHALGKRPHVFVDETRPRLQGLLTALELSIAGVSHEVVSDSCCASLMRTCKIAGCFVGADRVAKNGDTANKIGTYTLACAAARHKVPFYVCSPTTTIDLNCESGDEIVIEERSHDEVRSVRRGGSMLAIAPSFFKFRNPAFDVTPAEIISAIVTERGVCRAPFDTSIGRVKADAGEAERLSDEALCDMNCQDDRSSSHTSRKRKLGEISEGDEKIAVENPTKKSRIS